MLHGNAIAITLFQLVALITCSNFSGETIAISPLSDGCDALPRIQ